MLALMSVQNAGWFRKLPKRIRKPVALAQSIAASDVWRDPRGLAAQWKHRNEFAKLQKSLFYHRYANAILLGHSHGVFDALEQGAKTADEISGSCQLTPRAAEAQLRILHAQGMVERNANRYQLSEFAHMYLTTNGPFSVADTLSLMREQLGAFNGVADGMRTGRAPAALDIHLQTSAHATLVNAVNEYLKWATIDLLRQIQLPEIESFIVGSMGVSFSATVLKRFPASKVTYGCLDHLVRQIPDLRRKYAVPDHRVASENVHAGDPMEDTWGDEEFDLVLLTKKMILDPDNKLGEKFARKAYDVLRPDGVTILWETLHTETHPTPIGRAMEAVLDLGASPDGLVLTEDGVQSFLYQIGYRDVQIVTCMGGQSTFVVARK